MLGYRFGEEALHSCEVMLRDIEESRRTNTSVHSALKSKAAIAGSTIAASNSITISNSDSNSDRNHSIVDFAIVSDNYWPAVLSPADVDIDPSSATQHPMAQKWLDEYHATYKVLKAPRKLEISPHLGVVDIDLDFDDGTTRNFNVNPIQV